MDKTPDVVALAAGVGGGVLTWAISFLVARFHLKRQYKDAQKRARYSVTPQEHGAVPRKYATNSS